MFDTKVLQKAFYHIEGHDEKFPTVARCIEVCGIHAPQKTTPFYPEGVDKNGAKCWIDLENGDYLYAAKDCPEGREFLKKLAEIAQKVSMPGAEKRLLPAGVVECRDCKQAYPAKEFMSHTCPEKAKALERIERRRRSA